jgi:hypothetical protein
VFFGEFRDLPVSQVRGIVRAESMAGFGLHSVNAEHGAFFIIPLLFTMFGQLEP